jgi:hypothetical protein
MPPSFAEETPQNPVATPETAGNHAAFDCGSQPPAPAEMPIEIPAEAVYNENL